MRKAIMSTNSTEISMKLASQPSNIGNNNLSILVELYWHLINVT